MTKISLQGDMAVGKTTVAKGLERLLQQDYTVLFEYPKIRPEGLDPSNEQDYYAIQKYFIQLEIQRCHAYHNQPVIFDTGPEEIEFYTLNFPRSLGKVWKVEEHLREELDTLRTCCPDHVLFLEAPAEVLRGRKEHDASRKRGFFDHYMTSLYPLKKAWFRHHYDTEFIDVSQLNEGEVVDVVLEKITRKRHPD